MLKGYRKTIVLLMVALLAGNLHSYGQIDKVKNLPKYDHAPYHFGFILAANKMFFSIKTKPWIENVKYTNQDLGGDSLFLYSVHGEPTVGFTIGIVGNLRIGKYFDLRLIPSLAFGERHLKYSILKYEEDNPPLLVDIEKNVTSTFVEFPLHIKYKSKRFNNVRAYLIGGFKYTLDLASNANKKKDNADETYIKLKKHDVLADIGVGFDFYTPFFKFGTEIKMSYGLLDVLIRDGTMYSEGIERINSKIFLLSFTFE